MVKTVQYADDCIIFLNDQHELYTAMNIIHEYEKVSGLSLKFIKM